MFTHITSEKVFKALDIFSEFYILIKELVMVKTDDKVMAWWNARPRHERKGNLLAILRKGGRMAHLFRYYLGGKPQRAINFPHRRPLKSVKATIKKIEAAILQDQIKRKFDLHQIETKKRIRPITLKDLLDWYLSEIAEKKSFRTIRNYKNAFNSFARWLGGQDIKVTSLSIDDINRYKMYLSKRNSDLTIYNHIKLIRSIFSNARWSRVISNDPFIYYRSSPKKSNASYGILTPKEMRQISDMIWRERKSHWQKIWLAWQFAIHTGMSGANILKLKFEDIDYENELVAFKSPRHNYMIIILPIRSALMNILKRLKSKRGPIFSFKEFTWTEQMLTKKFGYYIRKLKGSKFKKPGSQTPRNSFSHILIKHGVSLENRQMLLGHSIPDDRRINLKRLRQIVESIPL